jgi:uncharacterized protein
MRKRSTLDALFPKTRQGVLATTLLDPAREWYLSELARHLKVRPSSLQRELANLSDAGFLVSRADGNRVYYRAEPRHPLFKDLRGLILRTVGLADVLQKALHRFRSRIRVAFVHGSIARQDEHAASDVDLMILGDVGLAEVAPALRRAESQLLRPVNSTIYEAPEAARKVRDGHHFLLAVASGPKLFIIGGENDLEDALGLEPRPTSRDEPARDR